MLDSTRLFDAGLMFGFMHRSPNLLRSMSRIANRYSGVLELGCGDCRLGGYLNPLLPYVGVDSNPRYLSSINAVHHDLSSSIYKVSSHWLVISNLPLTTRPDLSSILDDYTFSGCDVIGFNWINPFFPFDHRVHSLGVHWDSIYPARLWEWRGGGVWLAGT